MHNEFRLHAVHDLVWVMSDDGVNVVLQQFEGTSAIRGLSSCCGKYC